jgi:hypothetical protein
VSTLADLRAAQEELVRKPLDGAVFRKDIGDGTDHIDITTLFDATPGSLGELKVLPTGYKDQGLLSTEGYNFSREVQTSSISAFGRTTPVRSDVTGDTDTFTFVAIETNLQTIGLGTGAVLTSTSADTVVGGTGALEIKKPVRPKARNYRWLAVAQDENEFGEIYIARYLPRGKVTGYGDQVFGSGDEPIGWSVTVTGENDSAWGSPGSWLFGGPGWNALLVQMGFEEIASA